MTYEEWIEFYAAQQPDRFVRGKCAEATRLMVEAFPELQRVAGFVYVPWGRDEHWWCRAPDGSIVDPTRSQFPQIYHYEELNLSDPETRKLVPTGRCMDCGDDVYEGKTFCDERCEAATRAYLGV